MAADEAAPPGIDVSVPSIARVYDYFLGGKDNFAVDRQTAQMALKIAPDAPEAGQANRGFLRRSVRYLAREEGIRQFIDLGSGLPTQGNVHEIAHSVDRSTRVVYVDNDPIVLAHARALLADNHTTAVIQADVREPEALLAHPELARFIDFGQPVGLLAFSILHHLRDEEDPAGISAILREALPSRSCLAVSHFHNPGEAHPEIAKVVAESEKIFNETLGTGRWRTREEILEYTGDWELIDPGVVPLAEWRPDPADPTPRQGLTYHQFLALVARKP
jgi:hypothetical protein